MTLPSKIFHHCQRVTIEKLAAAPNPVASPGSWEHWVHGSIHNPSSLPISYTMAGYLRFPIQIGDPIILLRTHRNGIECLGYFRSTPVVAIREREVVETYNSVYRVSFEVSSGEEAR